MNSGLINEAEAKARRKELSMEAEFYGAMDGAAKFVSGDAVAGIFILFINVIGGFLVGCLMKGMHWQEALQVYMILTIGDGLVSQIPSIIISIASGLIVARAASGEDLGSDVLGQLGSSSKPLYLTAAVCGGFAILPGLPFLPFITLAGLSAGAAFYKDKMQKEEKVTQDRKALEHKADADKPKPGSTEEVTGLLGMDTLELEVGFELVGLVEGGDLVERIRSIRRQFALDYGFIVPPIHIRDNVRIKSNEYRFLLKGAVLGSGNLKPNHLLAMDPGNVSNPIDGTPTKEPAFGLDAIWITEPDKERASFGGYTVVDLPTVVTTHLTELIRANMSELLARQETQHLIDTVQKEAPKVVEELIPTLLTVGQVQQVLRLLLKEQISIRDLRTILETLADWAPTVKHPEKLAEFVRRRLSRSITAKYLSPEGTLPLASLNGTVEKVLNEAVQHTDEGSYLALEPSIAQRLINRLTQVSEKFMERGLTPVILAPGHVRAALAHFIDRFTPGISVISHQEIAPNTRVQSLGVVAIDE
jgi:flagellar biosynthesis protein FlhA